MTMNAPDHVTAGDLVAAALGKRPIDVRRFSIGLRHYVFEATFADGTSVVIRIAAEHSRQAMIDAVGLSRRLRPIGVPLPEIIAERLDHRFPHLVLERLPGTDLGHMIAGLSDTRLHAIAARVVDAQAITATTPSAGRFGYATAGGDAPHARWSQVLDENLDRSRRRIAAAGLFDQGVVDTVAGMVAQARGDLDSLPAIAFLHDTTTKNVIVTSQGQLSGIVDVDDLCFGDPRYVVALTLASLKAFGGSTHYVDAWMKSANFRNDGIFQLYVALFLVDFMSEQGHAFNANARPASPEARARMLHIFGEHLRSITEAPS